MRLPWTTSEETEARLVAELRRHFPDAAMGRSLPDILAELREGVWLQPGEKLVIVLDQFEQWLHGWQHDTAALLIETLRQCDGGRVQALILVRDDFWMPATRFFQQLDVAIVEGSNSSAVDLFDRSHAVKILAALGVAYGRLDADSSRWTAEQKLFLEQAIDELAEGGWIVPVRLCIFAEMVKYRPWSPSLLSEVGGTRGLGTAFLEEVFSGRSASPMHRLYNKPARLALERLLPPPGTNIRGHLVSEAELRAATNYEQQSVEFAALIRCLDHELRLITPSDTGLLAQYGAVADEPGHPPLRYFQLTHDFLVTAIRGWLNQNRRRTFKGRAELRLAEYAAAYTATREARQLPSWWEWLNVLLLTRWRQWKHSEQAMMRAATSRYLLRGAAIVGIAALSGTLIYGRMVAIRTDGLVQSLVTCDSRDLPRVVSALPAYRERVNAILSEKLQSDSQDRDQLVRVLLGLLATGQSKSDELFDEMLAAEPQLSVAIVDILSRYGKIEELQSRLWSVASDPQVSPSRLLRASMALAKLAPAADADKWPTIADNLSAVLLRDIADNPSHFNACVDALMPTKEWIIGPLRVSFANLERTDAERLLAASVLARYSADDIPQLLELAFQATPRQFDVFAKILALHLDRVRPDLLRESKVVIPSDAAEPEKDRIAHRRANAILLLHEFDDDEPLWPSLVHQPDPRLRSFLINHLRHVPKTPDDWLNRLSREQNPGVRQSLIFILGSPEMLSLAPLSPAGMRLPDLTATLLRIYGEDVDAGVHGAAEWALRRLGQETAIDQAKTGLAKLGIRAGYGWYVTKSRITMTIFEPPGEVVLGSPDSEPGRDARDEGLWKCNMYWSFAVSTTEITQAEFLEICPMYPERLNEFAPLPTCPANAIQWTQAIEFCRLLSEFDDVAEDQMAVPAVENVKNPTYPDFLSHVGYRLPTETEWEVACRAGTVTPRYFGYAPELLTEYSCYTANANGVCWSVGTGLPNAAGLFDTLENVSEWCFNIYEARPAPARVGRTNGFLPLAQYAIRGNDNVSNARMMRAANRRHASPIELPYSRGFRIAHTISHSTGSN